MWRGRCMAGELPSSFHQCGEGAGHDGNHVCLCGAEYDGPDAAPYDPSGHTVAEVVEHLATVDDAERERIVKAERGRGGRKRSGILNA